MGIKITEDGTVRYVNENDVDRTLFPNLFGAIGDEQYDALNGRLTVVEGKVSDLEECCDDVNTDIGQINNSLEHTYSAFVVETESGAVASFTDGADDVPVKDLTVAIEPVQSGSGDPSPENVRPISGWTGANVMRTGKNIVSGRVSNCYINQSGTITDSSSYDMCYAEVKAGVTYTVTTDESGLVCGFFSSMPTKYAVSYNGNRIIQTGKTITSPINGYIAFRASAEYSTPQLELGSTATAYEPYQGETYEVDWTTEAGTVYDGTLDVTTGVLTVDTTRYKFTGSEAYTQLSGSVAIKTGLTLKNTGDGYCTDFEFNGTGSTNFIYLKTTLTAEDLKTYMRNHDVYAVVVLAQAQTYQLTPQEVSTLLGQNNIFADCGSVNVQYRADTKLYIDKVLSA